MKAPTSPFAGEQPKRVQFGVDWLAFTVKQVPGAQVQSWMVKCFGEEWKHWETLSQRERRKRSRGPFGTLMEVDWVERWVHVQIKGQACRALGTEKVMRMCETFLQKFGGVFQVKRVDLAWDDFDKRCSPSQLRERFWDREVNAKRPEVVCRAKCGHIRQDDGPEGGESYTIGERSSQRMLRVYDKAAESGGKVDAVRWELQCREEVAQWAVEHMLRQDYWRAALAFLVGFLDFKEVDRTRKVKDRVRCAWFESMVGDARQCPLRPLERVDLQEWLETYLRQQSSGFRVLLRICGADWTLAGRMLMKGNPRDNPRHRGWHERLRREGLGSVASFVKCLARKLEEEGAPATPLN